MLSFGHSITVLWRGIGRTNTMRALTLCAMLGALVALGIYSVREPVDVQLRGPARSASAEREAQFRATRVGQLTFSSPASDNCKLLQFDNNTGAFQDAGERFCGRNPDEEASPSSELMQKMMDSFKR
jgi:hypothetical protein